MSQAVVVRIGEIASRLMIELGELLEAFTTKQSHVRRKGQRAEAGIGADI